MQKCLAVFLLLGVACSQPSTSAPAADAAVKKAVPAAAPADARPAAAGGLDAAAPTSAPVPSAPDATAPRSELKPSGSRVGVAVCDEYLDKMARCITRISPEAQPPMKNAMDDSRKAWQANAATPEGRAALENTCKQALDAAKSAAAAMGCEW